MSYSDLIQRDNPAIVWSLDDTESLTSAVYISATSATFTAPNTSQIFAVGQVINIQGVSGGNYNQVVTVTAIGGTSGAYTFTATGTGFTNVSGTGGKYSLIVRPDLFMYKTYTNNTTRTYYNGTYSNVIATGLPLIYGGKQSIKITNDTGYIRVPSLDKMSIKDSRNASSLEFWVKLSSSSDTERVLVRKTDMDNSQTPDYATCIYIKDDYITFRLGITTKYYEVSVPIDTTNKPLHIVANYSKEAITLIVNGVSKTKSIFNPDSLFPAYDADDEIFEFIKPSGITQVEYDCISLYSYSLPREKALKHFIYGVGYSLPSEIVNSNAGVFYNFSMDGHKEINKYDMGPGTAWSITEANNCLIQNGLLTIKNKQEPVTYFADNTSILDTTLFTESNTYSFIDRSYLEIENINSIIPDSVGGWAAKFDEGTYAETKKVLLSIGSKSSQNYIEFYTITESGTNKINVDINGTAITLKTGHTLATEFYIGYYKDIAGVSNAFFLTSGSQVVTPLTIPEIPSAYARLGSDNIWFDGADVTKLESNTAISDSKLLKIVGIHKDNVSLYDTYDEIEGINFKHYYTAIPNTLERRFKIKSYAQATIDIDQQLLCPPLSEVTGACRIEIGNPSGSKSVLMSLYSKAYSNGTESSSTTRYTDDYENRVITSGTWLNKKTTQTENSITNPVDALSFVFTFNTDDLTDKPPYLNYFRIAAYALNNDFASPATLTSASYNSSTSATFTVNLSSQVFAIDQAISISGVTGGNYNQEVIVTAVGGTSGAYTFTASGTGFTNVAGTGGSYSINYILNNSSPGGNPAKIYLKSGECNIPDIIEMPFFYNGYKSGLRLKESYAKINHNFTSVQKFAQITNVSVASGNATYTLVDNPFVAGDIVSVSEINGTNQFAFLSKAVSSVSGNNIVFTGFAPTGTYAAESEGSDGTAGVMQLTSGISTVSFMAYIESTTTPGTDLKIIKIGDSQFTANNFSGVRVLADATTYVNGVAYNATTNKVKLNEWQMITLVFDNPFPVVNGSPVEVILGDPSTALSTNVYIDQLMIFDKKLTTASGLGSLDNLYNNFVGNITNNFKSTKSKEVFLKDSNEMTVELYDYVNCDYLVSSGDIYDALVSGTSTETLTISYAKSTGNPLISKQAYIPAATGQTSIFLADTSNLYAGSMRVNAANNTNLGTISSLDATANQRTVNTANTSNGDIPFKRDDKSFISTVTLASSSGIEVNDRVVKAGYLDPGAVVNSKSGNVVKIKFGTKNTKYPKAKAYGIIKAVPKNTSLTFVEPAPKVVMSANLTTAIAKAETVYFRDKVYYENAQEREKLKISGASYIKTGDKILVINDSQNKYMLYTVALNAEAARSISESEARTYDVTFTKHTLSESELYVYNGINYKYSQADNNLTVLSTANATKVGRVSFKFEPQYAITE